jgi:lysophospholipase L1-like esterase
MKRKRERPARFSTFPFPQSTLRNAPMKLLSLFFVLLTAVSLHADPAKWEKEIASFETADTKAAPAKGGIVFIGSSSIRMWKTLKADFPDQNVINRGFGGSQIEDSVHFTDRLILPHNPRMIVLYAGGNDINAGKEPDRVVADYQAFVAKVRAKLPDVEIAYISIAGNPARWKQVEKVKEVNRRIEEITKKEKGLTFINVFPHMLGPDGQPKPDIFLPDQLHMNEKGYAIWKEVVTPFLAKNAQAKDQPAPKSKSE